jgi:hypothetical protein
MELMLVGLAILTLAAGPPVAVSAHSRGRGP